MQTIDPVMPFQSRHARRRASLAQRPRKRLSIDGILPKKRPKAPVSAASKPPQRQPESARKYRSLDPVSAPTTGLKIVRPHARLKKNFTISMLAVLAVLVLAAITHQPIGLLLVVGYGIVALMRRISARVTFVLALIFLALVPASLFLLGGRSVVTSALASYGFLLLAIGVITLWREMRWHAIAD